MKHKYRKTMNRFFALSRTYHAVLDIAAPAFCCLLWLGRFPSLEIVLLGLFSAFCGYTAVYALNDIIDFSLDKQKFAYNVKHSGYAVESTNYHHPLARDFLSYKAGFLWAAFWFLGALVGAYLLNPVIIVILFIGVSCEYVYCKLFRVTPWRIVFSGIVKTCGPIAAVFAVDSTPSIFKIGLLFTWLFLWEIGGQNIPADWNDKLEDKMVGGKTIPLCMKERSASLLIFMSLLTCTFLSLFLPLVTPVKLGFFYIITNLCVSYFLLLKPALHLYKMNERTNALSLFNKASYYPFVLLIILLIYVERVSLP